MTAAEPGSFNWQAAHQRLESARQAVETTLEPVNEARLEILRARARALAQTPLTSEAQRHELEVLEFSLAQETYGVESSFVREVYPLKELTPLPCTPPFVLGLVNVRGQIVTVVDLKKFFGLPEKGLTELNKLIILDSGEMAFGILADAVLEVRSIPTDDIQSSLPTLSGARQEFLKGVTRERVVILDASKLLASKDIIVHEEVEGWQAALHRIRER